MWGEWWVESAEASVGGPILLAGVGRAQRAWRRKAGAYPQWGVGGTRKRRGAIAPSMGKAREPRRTLRVGLAGNLGRGPDARSVGVGRTMRAYANSAGTWLR